MAISGNVDTVKPTVTLNDVTISNNIAEQNTSGIVTVIITISDPNKLTIVAPRGNGGGMTVTRGDVTVNGGLITGNLATIAGGFAHQLGTLTFTGTTISKNTAISAGGGAIVETSTGVPVLTMTSVKIDDNSVELNATGTIAISVPGSTVTEVPRGAGGGLAIAGGNTNISNSEITRNDATQAGGIAVRSGRLVLSTSLISENTATATAGGVGVLNGSFTMTDSTVDRNAAKGGAGIAMLDGSLVISRSTISGNIATGEGVEGSGGGIGIMSGMVAITNSTIDGNRAAQAGGLAIGGGTINVFSSTITANEAQTAGGVGIDTGKSISIRNSVIALNSAGQAPDVAGTFVSSGGNFVGAANFSTGFTATGDRTGTQASRLDPKLGVFQNNGGSTKSRLPNSDSPLLNSGNPMDATMTDQRNRTRIVGAEIDIGALERQSDDPFVLPPVPPVPEVPVIPPGTSPPPGTIPPGSVPPGSVPPGTIPPGSIPPIGTSPTPPLFPGRSRSARMTGPLPP